MTERIFRPEGRRVALQLAVVVPVGAVLLWLAPDSAPVVIAVLTVQAVLALPERLYVSDGMLSGARPSRAKVRFSVADVDLERTFGRRSSLADAFLGQRIWSTRGQSLRVPALLSLRDQEDLRALLHSGAQAGLDGEPRATAEVT